MATSVGEYLTAIVERVREAGAVPVTLTYPVALTPNKRAVNRSIADTAQRAHRACLDTARIARRLREHGHGGLFFPDMHPTATAPPRGACT